MKILISFSLFLLMLISTKSQGSHIFGADLSYTHLSGLTYQITLTLYGDCSGNSFPSLPTSVPEIKINNGFQTYATINLQPFGNSGVEVTPVCPSQLTNTKCTNPNNPLPGVAQFIFKGNITLNVPSANWNFIFDGGLGGQSAAGRSNQINNIVQSSTGSSVMRLEATLNNSTSIGQNNAATYTTIPTPFFCLNLPQQYNQAAVDADGDVLTYQLVPGLEPTGILVAYNSGYTFSDPLDVQPGSFSFNGSNGQMNFTPNTVNNYLVVSKVTETRNGVVVGTSMREMVFVMQNNCNNQPPSGAISSSNAGSINANGSIISICNGSTDSLFFSILGNDPDANNLNAVVNGLPSFASVNIVNNNTPNPIINITAILPQPFVLGDYTFFITFTDDGCPLSSKQTIAYTIRLINPFTVNNASVTDESCVPTGDGTITITAASPNGNISYSMDGTNFQSGNIFNNLISGQYIITIKDGAGCLTAIQTIIKPAVAPIIDSAMVKDISCYGLTDGAIQLDVTANASCTYTLLPGNVVNNQGNFLNLSQNNYTILVVDTYGCTASTTASITEPPVLTFSSVVIQNLFCDKTNGKIVATSTLKNGIYYFLKPGIGANSSGIYDNLPANTYTLSVRNENGCSHDTVITVGTDPNNFAAFTTQQDLPCQGNGFEGMAEVFANGGKPPYSYLWTSREMAPSADSKITNLYYGWYFVTTTDAVGCETKDTVYVKPGNCCENIFAPSVFTPNGDGINDTWKITTSNGLEIHRYLIYNRWGNKIWDAEDQRETWDGKQLGRIVDNGTYYFLLKYKCLVDGKTYIKKGEINVLN